MCSYEKRTCIALRRKERIIRLRRHIIRLRRHLEPCRFAHIQILCELVGFLLAHTASLFKGRSILCLSPLLPAPPPPRNHHKDGMLSWRIDKLALLARCGPHGACDEPSSPPVPSASPGPPWLALPSGGSEPPPSPPPSSPDTLSTAGPLLSETVPLLLRRFCSWLPPAMLVSLAWLAVPLPPSLVRSELLAVSARAGMLRVVSCSLC